MYSATLFNNSMVLRPAGILVAKNAIPTTPNVRRTTQGITVEKKEARAEKEEAERFQRLTQELVSVLVSVGIGDDVYCCCWN